MKPTRRRLLKGTSAVPLLFTMRSGSAQALASGGVCMAQDALRAAGATKPPEIQKVATDGWLRVRLDLCELSTYQNNKSQTLAGKYFLGADNSTYWKLVEQFRRETAVMTQFTVNSCSARKTGEFRYGLVYVDAAGNKVGYVLQTNGGQPVTTSCWTSVVPTRT